MLAAADGDIVEDSFLEQSVIVNDSMTSQPSHGAQSPQLSQNDSEAIQVVAVDTPDTEDRTQEDPSSQSETTRLKLKRGRVRMKSHKVRRSQRKRKREQRATNLPVATADKNSGKKKSKVHKVRCD